MKLIKSAVNYFSKGEILLWACSVGLIVASFCIFDRENFLTLAASLIGTTSLIFNAKGNPAGQLLMIVFSIIYGFISWNKMEKVNRKTHKNFYASYILPLPAVRFHLPSSGTRRFWVRDFLTSIIF